jgi:hypothetical protein
MSLTSEIMANMFLIDLPILPLLLRLLDPDLEQSHLASRRNGTPRHPQRPPTKPRPHRPHHLHSTPRPDRVPHTAQIENRLRPHLAHLRGLLARLDIHGVCERAAALHLHSPREEHTRVDPSAGVCPSGFQRGFRDHHRTGVGVYTGAQEVRFLLQYLIHEANNTM